MSGLLPCSLATVRDLCERYHGYGSAGGVSVYCFAVYEAGEPVAVFSWQPPPPGAARAVCPEAPQGVLALSRMCAVPRDERDLQHISKPLRRQMRRMLDRTRWPVLVTYSDEGQGHTGHVYKCSGWQKTERSERPVFVDRSNARASSYSNGKHGGRSLSRAGSTTIQRWEHRVTEAGTTAEWMARHGWRRERIAGKFYRSGNPAFRWVSDTAHGVPGERGPR